MAGVPANKSVKSDLIVGVPVNKSVKSDLIVGVPANKSVKSDLIAEPPAALSAFTVASAQVAPLSRHLLWHRRRLRRSLGICCGVGAGCAAFLAFAVASAQVAPLSRHLLWRRRRLRRSLGICRGIGAGCAALPAFAVASAQVAPLSRHLPESLGKGALTGGSQRGIAYVELTFCNAKYYQRSLRPGACGGIGRTIMTPTVRLLRAA